MHTWRMHALEGRGSNAHEVDHFTRVEGVGESMECTWKKRETSNVVHGKGDNACTKEGEWNDEVRG